MINLKVTNARKYIKKRLILDNISFEINKAGIYGFTGINGSGKSMLFKAIAGLIHLDSGSIEIDGKQIGVDCPFPENMGLVISASFWDEYTGLENLKIIASIRKIATFSDIENSLRRVGLDPNDTRLYKHFSLGMKQRLELAQAIMEKPDLYIFDEPSNGLDKDGLSLLLQIINEEYSRGATILVASHNTPEISSLCHRQFEISNGKIISDTGDR